MNIEEKDEYSHEDNPFKDSHESPFDSVQDDPFGSDHEDPFGSLEEDPDEEEPFGVHLEEREEEDDDEEEEVVERVKYRGKGENFEPLPRKKGYMYDDSYLTERLDGQIAYFNAKSSKAQKQYKKFKKREFVISASIPILITLAGFGFVENFEIYGPLGFGLAHLLQIIAAAGGAYLAYLSQFQGLEGYLAIWKEYRATCEQLQHERYLYLAKAEPYDEDDAFPILVTSIENILHKENQRWMQVQRGEKKKKEEKKEENKGL
ncbi:MAG: DUF4231 domain-containing protein [Bacteroidota bacterium]